MEKTYRKQIRLKTFDYSSNGAYFVTICTKNKEKLFWKSSTDEGDYELSDCGIIVDNSISMVSQHYPNISVEKYVIMPNHIHMILLIDNPFGLAMRAPTIGNVLCQMKGYITKQIGKSIWQKSFYDHIIRDERDYQKIWDYIDTNPLKWTLDCYYVEGW